MKTREITVRIAELALGRPGEVLVSRGLGSCVAVILHDAGARLGGMAHVLLPDPALARDASNPAKFASTAVPLLLERMLAAGAARERLTATLVGGASMFTSALPSPAMNLGARNVEVAREALGALGIPLRAEDVGGERGRSVRFVVAEGRVRVTSVAAGPLEL